MICDTNCDNYIIYYTDSYDTLIMRDQEVFTDSVSRRGCTGTQTGKIGNLSRKDSGARFRSDIGLTGPFVGFRRHSRRGQDAAGKRERMRIIDYRVICFANF